MSIMAAFLKRKRKSKKQILGKILLLELAVIDQVSDL